MSEAEFDVVQIGYGPVSEALALMLGRQGRRVAVCERWPTRYPLPRAVCIDHEIYRVLAANGLGDVLPSVSHPGPLYQWFNADWKELLVIDWGAASISGGPEVNFVHQPTLEDALDRAVAAQPSVDRFLGWEAIAIEQADDLARVTLREVESGRQRVLSARYVVGCDGANSLTRRTIGGAVEDRGFDADWLVIDVLLKDAVTIEKLGIPAAGQLCDPRRPTTIVPAGVSSGRLFRRWEFMRLPGEAVEELEREERVWQLLEPWAGPDDVELVRHKVYNFRSLLVEQWRDRRLLIAGDAAHVMPPFMGQGMCSGIRDSWNLAWKLNLILVGKADGRLLDSYARERRPHVSALIDLSIYLGKIICLPDVAAAAERDRAFFNNSADPPPAFPQLIDGLLHRDAAGKIETGAGLLSPHVDLQRDGVRARLDDVVGKGGRFVVIGRGFDPARTLPATIRQQLSLIGTDYLALAAATAQHDIRDLDGRLDRFLAERDWAGMIVRPDFYVYGGATDPAAVGRMAADLVCDLKDAGVRTELPTEP